MNYDEFKKKLKLTGLSEEDFSKITHTPMPTIRGWATKRTYKTPKWVSSYLDLYERYKQKETVIKYLEDKINGNK